MKTIDYKFSELCEEIDFWKREIKRYKKLYKTEVKKNETLKKLCSLAENLTDEHIKEFEERQKDNNLKTINNK